MHTRPGRAARAPAAAIPLPAIPLPAIPLLAILLLALALTLVPATGCDRKEKDDAVSAATEAEAVEVAPPAADRLVMFEMALYLLSPAKQDLEAQVAAARAGSFADLAQAVREKRPDGPVMRARVAPLDQYAPPDAEVLGYSGRGLTPDQLKRLRTPAAAWVIDFACPWRDTARTVRRAGELMLHLARRNDALIWDEQTREVFTPDAWQKQRVEGWDDGTDASAAAAPTTAAEAVTEPTTVPTRPAGVPDVSRHVTIHYYTLTEGRPPRAITLGMAKFGCPDVVMQEVPRADVRSAGALINVVCQTLVERGVPPESSKPRAFKVDLEALRHREVKASALTGLKEGGSHAGILTIRPAARDQGDPDNRLVELTFDRQPGKTPIERQAAFLVAFFGAEDKVSIARDDDAALSAARDRARAVLLSQKKPQFRKGLPPGDALLVKAPFKTDDNSVEWMWVEVLSWDAGGEIRGILQNKPMKVRRLHPGVEVTVSEQDLFDYILRHADGTAEGNETGKILEKQER